MKEVFKRIMDEYLTEKGEGEFADNALGNFVRREAPSIISKEASLTNALLVTGAVGQGNWAEIPWICVFDKQITTSAQHGYYIVYLFKRDMLGVYLSLNMGWTQFKEKYNNAPLARQQIKATADVCKERLVSGVGDFSFDPIDLKATNALGIGYELGHICGKYYSDYSFPGDIELINDLRNLIGVYRELKGILGTQDITKLIGVHREAIATEDEAEDTRYNKNVERAEPKNIPPTPQNIPPHTQQRGRNKWRTDPGIGKASIINCGYQCEIDPNHVTFTSKVTGQNFVEVHHLIPMANQADFSYSLDVPANIIPLCPNCHRQLHHGKREQVMVVLGDLLNRRTAALEQAGISSSANRLMAFYKLT
ncbi:MrcB family domain-containing protein [Chloroflexota bacterium]